MQFSKPIVLAIMSFALAVNAQAYLYPRDAEASLHDREAEADVHERDADAEMHARDARNAARWMVAKRVSVIPLPSVHNPDSKTPVGPRKKT